MRRTKILRQPLERLLTERATQVLDLSREAAAARRHNYASTEHLLLGLIHLNAGVAIHTLTTLEVPLQGVRDDIEEHIGHGTYPPMGEIEFTPGVQQVLQLSRREAFELGHRYVGTEHLLLGFLREGQGVAARILTRLGADIHCVRQQVIHVLQGPIPAEWN